MKKGKKIEEERIKRTVPLRKTKRISPQQNFMGRREIPADPDDEGPPFDLIKIADSMIH